MATITTAHPEAPLHDDAQFLATYNPMTYPDLLAIANRHDAQDIPRLVEAVVKLKRCYDEIGAAQGWPAHAQDCDAAGQHARLLLTELVRSTFHA